jgi:hypothetical protein
MEGSLLSQKQETKIENEKANEQNTNQALAALPSNVFEGLLVDEGRHQRLFLEEL